jgi:hypothetical protein
MEATTFYAINETRDCHGKRCWLFDVWGHKLPVCC